ncbi:conserved exported hypothetical protein [Cupriavidus taiwanensis]|uniref:Uncharacterized protein n=1 Tax=Cupriavidus taiwanensis TaxID=164546 RepID=A0A375CRY1_9BURK|nr:hypothetical protein [Cupriavidus taiwanensis]SOY78166.1 conserved exported hypothetical protein [Cupriavidus taiwanensis]
MEQRTYTEQRKSRQRRPYLALTVVTAALALAYGVARHLSWASSMPPQEQQQFTVYVDRDKAPWERPVLALREGVPSHINVHSKLAGVLMVHEIPGAFAACGSGNSQSLDIFPVDITGRFSLHFHSQDGEQIEVATIEIYPR